MDLSELIKYVIEGPTNHTAYRILKALQQNEIDWARNEYQQDGDKLDTKARRVIEKLLGCRNHLKHNCTEGFCGYFASKFTA